MKTYEVLKMNYTNDRKRSYGVVDAKTLKEIVKGYKLESVTENEELKLKHYTYTRKSSHWFFIATTVEEEQKVTRDEVKEDAYAYALSMEANHIYAVPYLRMEAYVNDYVKSKYEDKDGVDVEDFDELIDEVMEEWAKDTRVAYHDDDNGKSYVTNEYEAYRYVYINSSQTIMTTVFDADSATGTRMLMTGAELYKMRKSEM